MACCSSRALFFRVGEWMGEWMGGCVCGGGGVHLPQLVEFQLGRSYNNSVAPMLRLWSLIQTSVACTYQ